MFDQCLVILACFCLLCVVGNRMMPTEEPSHDMEWQMDMSSSSNSTLPISGLDDGNNSTRRPFDGLLADDPEPVGNYLYNFSGPQDMVFIIDRSGSIGETKFQEEEKGFLQAFLRSAVLLHQDFTRVAVLTFTSVVSDDIDYISSGSQATTCEFFAPGGAFSGLKYDSQQNFGSDVAEALRRAQRILQRGRDRRPNGHSRQSVWVLSDGQDFKNDTRTWTSLVKKDDVDVYAVGLGLYLDRERIRSITSTPSELYYRSYEEWADLIANKAFYPRINDVGGQWEQVSSPLCGGCGSGASCYCQEFRDADPSCHCNPGFYHKKDACEACAADFYKELMGNDTTCESCTDPNKTLTDQAQLQCFGPAAAPSMSQNLMITLIVIHAIVVLVALVFTFVVCVIQKRHKEKDSQESSSGEEGESREIYTQTYQPDVNGDDDYINQVAVDLLADLGRSRRSRNPSGSNPNPNPNPTPSPSTISSYLSASTPSSQSPSMSRGPPLTRVLPSAGNSRLGVRPPNHHSNVGLQVSNMSTDSGLGSDRVSYMSCSYQTIPESAFTHEYIHPTESDPVGVRVSSDSDSIEDSHESKETILRLSKLGRLRQKIPSSIKRLPKLPKNSKSRKRDTLDHPSFSKENENGIDYENEATIGRIKAFGPVAAGSSTDKNNRRNYDNSKLHGTQKGQTSSIAKRKKGTAKTGSIPNRKIKNIISMFEKKDKDKELAHNASMMCEAGDYMEPVSRPVPAYITIIG